MAGKGGHPYGRITLTAVHFRARSLKTADSPNVLRGASKHGAFPPSRSSQNNPRLLRSREARSQPLPAAGVHGSAPRLRRVPSAGSGRGSGRGCQECPQPPRDAMASPGVETGPPGPGGCGLRASLCTTGAPPRAVPRNGAGAERPRCHGGASQLPLAWCHAVRSSPAHPPTHLLDISQSSYF